LGGFAYAWPCGIDIRSVVGLLGSLPAWLGVGTEVLPIVVATLFELLAQIVDLLPQAFPGFRILDITEALLEIVEVLEDVTEPPVELAPRQ